MSMPAPSNPVERMPIRSGAIHQGADRMLALIESEIQAHTAAAQKENAELRAALAASTRREAALHKAVAAAAARGDSTVHAQLQHANERIDRLTVVLAMFGVTCRRNGDVAGYDKEWACLLDAIKEADEGSDAEDIKMKEAGPVQLKSPFGPPDPMHDLARVRRLLKKRKAKAKHWREKFIEMEIDRDEQKKAMAQELDELRRQLRSAQSPSRSSDVPNPPPQAPQQ